MSRAVRSVKGTRDLLPPETELWARVEAIARRVFSSYGYGEIRTPILEATELFQHIGEETDIVGKEMYTFEDRKGRSLSLRPESTASVARAFVQHGLHSEPSPLKLYYIGPHFRYERPQKGRYRQFNQIGAEVLGDSGPYSDAELLAMLVRFLRQLGFDDLVVLLNTMGDAPSRLAFRQALVAYLEPLRDELSEESRRRLSTNPLRILDTKSPREKELLRGAPLLGDHLTPSSREHFEGLRRTLDRLDLAYEIDPGLVRGLDYYTSTVFEIVSEALGAQNAIVGGGRYDGLVSQVGGSEIPAIGFAIGQDRLIDILSPDFRTSALLSASVMVATLGEVDVVEALAVAECVRGCGVETVIDFAGGSARAVLKRADRRGVRYLVLIGEDELAVGEVSLKDLESGEQERLAAAELPTRIEESR